MVDKNKTRENILKMCEQDNLNPKDKYYLLRSFGVDNNDDLTEMFDYFREINNPPLPIPKEKNYDGPTKIYTPKVKIKKK